MNCNRFYNWFSKGSFVLCLSLIASMVVFTGCSKDDSYSSEKSSSKNLSKDFSSFLDECSVCDRIALMQTLKGLKTKINKNCYGKLSGLSDYLRYAEDENDVTSTRPLLPKTYNDVLPETVEDAIRKGHLSLDDVSTSNIKKQMVWRRYNKVNYALHEKENIDYHNDYVVWAAQKCGVAKDLIANLSTFDLEREIIKSRFAQVWNDLTFEQRKELLSKIENQNGSVGDKVSIASMSGGAAIAALSTTVAFSGFAFYTSLTTVMCTAAGWLGITLPFAAYTGATTTVAVLSGPIGWTAAGLAVVGGGIAAGWPNQDQIIVFVMTVNTIKARKIHGL